MKSPSDFVSTFLESVGQRQDVDLYLRIFRELPKESFAVIAAEPALLRHATGVVVEALHFLSELDLRVILALGLLGDSGPSLPMMNERLQRAEVPCEPVSLEGDAAGARLKARLRDHGSALVDLREFDATERARLLGSLLVQLGTRKLVILRSRGGLGPHRHGTLTLGPSHSLVTRDSGISVVNLTTDLKPLLSQGLLASAEQELVNVIAQLHSQFPSLLTSVTSPFHLIQELFTVKGAGTLVKTGSTITRHEHFGDIDVPRLSELISATFGKQLVTDLTALRPATIYLEQQYRGAAIVQAGTKAAYLSKFAVSQLAQGEGIGRDLWEALTVDHPALYWRADPKNPIVHWYAKECDGMQRTAKWWVYRRGVEADAIAELLRDACARPADFVRKPVRNKP